MNTRDLMLRDIERDVKTNINTNVLIVILCPRRRQRWIKMLRRSMLDQDRSIRRFDLLKKKVQVTTLSKARRKEKEAKQWKPSDAVADFNIIVEEKGEDSEKMMKELSACQQFLVDTEIENGRLKITIFQMSKLETSIINNKVEEIFNKLDSAAKIIFALGFFFLETVLRLVKLA